MASPLDVPIKRARLRERSGGLVDIGIASGRITAIQERGALEAQTETDAQGNLVTASFANPHLHLCKVHTLPMMDEEALKDYDSQIIDKE